jgi:DTW domain-containing protein YfiP
MRSRTAPDGGGRCPQCALHASVCACAVLARLPIRTRFVVVRHAREAPKSSNTARWATLLVPNCEILSWSGRPDVGQLADVGRPGDWLLFPGEEAAGASLVTPERLVVLDGTWRQVRRMLRALPILQGLPRLSVAARPGRVGLRRAPSPRHLSTLEAMSSAVAVLESEALAVAVDGGHRELVSRALSARGRRLPEAA